MVEAVSKANSKTKMQPAVVSLADQYNQIGSAFREQIDTQALSLPMCLHLSRQTLKSFLLHQADTEEVERAEDSILGQWAQIAKKKKTWLADEAVAMLPTMIKQRLVQVLETEGPASEG